MILHDLSEEELYFYVLFMDASGIDQAEFCLIDDTVKEDIIDEETGEPVVDLNGNIKQKDGHGCFRAWPVQQFWWRSKHNKILSQGSRSVGKSLSVKLKAFAFPFVAPGAEMVLTAPEGAHLDALTNNVENLFVKNKIAESMLAKDQRGRIKHRPFQVNFQNGSYILARLPKFDGSGIRGTHPLYLEQDEASFYPEPGWKEIIETVKAGDSRARWRAHGVTVGPGNTFDDKISGKDSTWKVFRLPAMYRPNWTEKERQDKIIEYGGEDSPDYRRNVKGLSANSGTPLVVMYRLMQSVDIDEMSSYNMEEYYDIHINDAQVREVGNILDLVDPPYSHTKYGRVWMGMDYGLTTSNSCIVIFGEVKEKGDDHGRLKLLSKITLTRIPTEDQVEVIKHLMKLYRPIALAFDAHGIGLPAYEWIQKDVRQDPDIDWMLSRIKGYSFSKKMIVGFDENIQINENDPDGWKEAAIEKLGGEASLDILRDMIDTGHLRLPMDGKLLDELQAIPRKELVKLDEYGKPKRKSGQHTLDAIRFAFLAFALHKHEITVAAMEKRPEPPSMIIMDYV